MDITVCISCIIKLFQVSDSNEATLAEAIEGYNSLYGHSKKLKVKMALSLPTPFRSFKHLGTKLPESRWLNYLPLIRSSRFIRIWIELLIQDLNRCLVGQWSLQFIFFFLFGLSGQSSMLQYSPLLYNHMLDYRQFKHLFLFWVHQAEWQSIKLD